jgi:hypothetical protein
MRKLSTIFVMVAALSLVAAVGLPAGATHSWGGYHWARTSNPFTLQVGDNVSGTWDGMLNTVVSDWSQSNVLDLSKATGGSKNTKRCSATRGRVEVCNSSYGNNGWLGIAQIWLSGKHIVQGIVKVNDFYFGTSTYQYNNSAEQLHVICQEIGHTLGLDHQSENGDSLNTCMDYYHNTSASDVQSTHPNTHDYSELASIYQHTDSTTTVGQTASSASSPGNSHETVSASKTSDGSTVITFILWK